MAASLEEHDRPARGRPGAQPALRRRRVARAADAARRARRRGVDPARGPRRRCPTGSRRAGELLVADVGRLRVLVDDLMEISRFDAGAEQVATEPVDLGRLVDDGRDGPPAGGRPRAARRTSSSSTPIRAGSSGSSATSSTTPASTRPGAPVEVRVRLDGRAASASSPSPTAARASRRTGCPTSSTASTRPIRPATAAAAGSGLAIAAEHATLLGGELTAANREGGGLRIELRLPVTRPLPGGDPAAIGRGRRSRADDHRQGAQPDEPSASHSLVSPSCRSSSSSPRCQSSGSLGTVPPLEPTPEPSLGSTPSGRHAGPVVPSEPPVADARPRAPPPPDAGPAGRHDGRPGLLRPRRRARQRGPRPVPPRASRRRRPSRPPR